MNKPTMLLLLSASITAAAPGAGVRLWGLSEITGGKYSITISAEPSVLLGDSVRHWELGFPIMYKWSKYELDAYSTKMSSVLLGGDVKYLRTLYRTSILSFELGGEFTGQYSLPPKIVESSPAATIEYEEKEYINGNFMMGIPLQVQLFLPGKFSVALTQTIFQISGDVDYQGITPVRTMVARCGIPKNIAPSLQLVYRFR